MCDLGSVVTICDEPQDLDLPVGEPRDPETARLQDLALKVPDLLEQPAQQVGWQGTGSCGGMHHGGGWGGGYGGGYGSAYGGDCQVTYQTVCKTVMERVPQTTMVSCPVTRCVPVQMQGTRTVCRRVPVTASNR